MYKQSLYSEMSCIVSWPLWIFKDILFIRELARFGDIVTVLTEMSEQQLVTYVTAVPAWGLRGRLMTSQAG